MKIRMLGISALVRCKDEEDFVYLSLLSIKDVVDEIIFIDNASCDNSVNQAKKFRDSHFKSKRFVLDFYEKDTFVGDNLAEMNNYALSKTEGEWIFKWDVDTIAQTKGDHSLHKIREAIKRKDADIFRFGYWNLWGDPFHFISNNKDEPEYGPTGCGFEMQGLEQRLFRFDESFRYSMTQYGEHFWERPNFPSGFKQEYLEFVPGVHMQTVKPSEVIARRYFLTRYGPKERETYKTFLDFVMSEVRKEGFITPLEFGKFLLINKVNKQGKKFEREYPILLESSDLLKNSPYLFLFEENTCIDRTEPIKRFNYFELK
nr:glycosyltransferase [Candidatus Woesearchaeota archaeon]